MTPNKVDEKTLIPLGWVLTLFTVGISVAIGGAFWVSSVNDRLGRIESKLGIKPYETALIRKALADEPHAR